MMETGFEHSQLFGVLRVLFQVIYTKIAAENNAAAIITFFSGDDIQQGGFAAAVLRYQPYTLTFGNAQRYIFKKNQVAEGLGQVIYL